MRNNTGLTEKELRIVARSAFDTQPAPTVSKRYEFIPSNDIVFGLQQAGFVPVEARQNRSKHTGAKHVISFRRQFDIRTLEVDELIPEICLTNSHDGRSAFDLSLGIFRCWCANQCVVGESMVQNVHITHRKVQGDVIEGAWQLIDEAPRVMNELSSWQRIYLPPSKLSEYLEEAAVLRWPDENTRPLTPDRLLTTRRASDVGDDLYHQFQRVQENLTRGGLPSFMRNEAGRRRVNRPLRAIDASTRVNKQLWDLTTEYARAA